MSDSYNSYMLFHITTKPQMINIRIRYNDIFIMSASICLIIAHANDSVTIPLYNVITAMNGATLLYLSETNC